ncbi:hypothetical protein HPB47_014769 [Ixodes persulcatus]|uniref:Uncharacterized protein n=1 Tax=Ixodes persulcatus TaxID=34615 RepID=A0AC60QXQ1_IXOPE|nr:hypothetical protein HPB47_014769 [Ixodes persulcatus]
MGRYCQLSVECRRRGGNRRSRGRKVSKPALGSDHYIIQLQILHQRARSQKIGTARITNWKNFREASPTGPIISLEDRTTQLLKKARENTKELSLTQDNPAIDAHLVHLWDACNGLLRRWRKNKTNRKLKTRIAKLTAEAEAYALQLSQLNWMQLCNKLQGTLGSRRTWHLLRSLLGTGESKAVTIHQLRRLIQSHPGTETGLLEELKQPLAAPSHAQPKRAPDYTGDPNPEMDEPFSLAEIGAAVYTLTRNTTPGRGKIPNKLLRNLDHVARQILLDYINDCWLRGSLPPQWKHADVTLILKPGKPLNPKNLRPISITSCVGKLFEHMVHNWLSPYIEDKGYFPYTMYGFLPHLSTQDILPQLKEEVLDSLNNHSKRSILTLDFKGAFDNISHQAILQGVASTNCGERTYKYFASFLTNRTATVGIGHL